MPGTRKMEKFELDALKPAQGDGVLEETGTAREGLVESETKSPARAFDPRAESEAPAAGDLPARTFETRKVSKAAGDLPARTFEPRNENEAGDLPVRTFDPRRENENEAGDLPVRTFDPRVDRDEATRPDVPQRLVASRGDSGGSEKAGLPERPFAPRSEPASASSSKHAIHQAPTPVVGWVPNEWIPPQEPAASPAGAEGGGAPDVEALRTQLARKFVTLADSVTAAFGEFSIGRGAYAVELTAPEGMSTGGGKQALQHVRLRPRAAGFAVFVAGTVNQIEHRAELRDYDHVAALHHLRFKDAFDIDREEWEQFLRKAEVVLNAAGIQSMRTPPPRDLLEQRRSEPRVAKAAIVVLVVVLLLAALVLWRVFLALTTGSPS